VRTLVLVGACATALITWCLHTPVVFSHETSKTTVTFDREISRIVRRKCLACHAEKTIAFPLTTYAEARSWARAIEEEILSRHMPPWRAAPGYGVFANDGSLSTRELQLLVAWIEGNGPKDSAQKIIANIDQFETADKDRLRLPPPRWELGTPTWIGELHAGTVEPGLADHVRTAVLDTGLAAPKWVRSIEIRPTDRRVVRAVFLTVEGTGQWLGSWTPWHGTVRLPEQTAFHLPAGARIVVESHYRSAREAVETRTQIGLHFADVPARCVSDLRLRATSDGEGRVRAVSVLAEAARVLALRPEVGEGVHAFEVRARTPDGATQILLFVKDALREWPTPYILKTPASLPRGTVLQATAYFPLSGTTSAAPRFEVTVSRDAESGCGSPTG
jgi:hypothetical protein